jgi:hypothetical protein
VYKSLRSTEGATSSRVPDTFLSWLWYVLLVGEILCDPKSYPVRRLLYSMTLFLFSFVSTATLEVISIYA